MAYCTLAEMVERFGEAMLVNATDRGLVASGTIDTSAIERAIADADALIDGYLSARYQLPLAAVPALIKTLSLTIAIYKAHPAVADEKLRKDYEDADKTLTKISRGDIRVDVGGQEPAQASHGEVWTNEPERPLSADSMRGYI